MGVTRTFRFRDYTIKADPAGLPTFAAVCVSGDETECGAQSGEEPLSDAVDKWCREHCRDTGHQRYQQQRAGFVIVEPGEFH